MIYKIVDIFFIEILVGNEILSIFAPSKMTRSGLFV